MPLFQSSVLSRFLENQDKSKVKLAYRRFTKYFLDTEIQKNIFSLKEEEYQGLFLNELFVNVLGYTMKPNVGYNLAAEFKNQNYSRKADGAILDDDKAIGIIELKGTNTTNLEEVKEQAFSYKVNHEGCNYVITSNFNKLWFYINNAVEHESFDLFNLTEERFEVLYLCIAKENLLADIPAKIKASSILQEEAITKKFYSDYSKFKTELFHDLVKINRSNPQFLTVISEEWKSMDSQEFEMILFKKSQKLIDRFLFIFFAEDRGLLPPNITVQILNEWNQLRELDESVPLYSRFNKYFGYLDSGREQTKTSAEIFAYNGGLFKSDPILDSLLISDELLYENTLNLSNYDFQNEVDVDVLGHIFENSLDEIESISAKIQGLEFQKNTKRKKDGVYYTPRYITIFMLEDSLGVLCKEKKQVLKISDEEYIPTLPKAKKKKRLNQLDEYRSWLLNLTILDPACGSGAFLNGALGFLINEHKWIDELQARLLGGGFIFPNIESTILEKNIYGVDLNEESVEIAKLSLWLRTAQPGRKLNDLSSNIKCGNSLIKDKSIAGQKAFDWHNEFPEILLNGGFDIIIGNPPYGAKLDKSTQSYLNKEYIRGGSETAISFIKLSHALLKRDGRFSFIIPKSFSFSSNYAYIREYLKEEIESIVDCGKVWSEVKLEQIIIGFSKNKSLKTYKTLTRKNQDIFQIGEIEKSMIDRFGFYLNGISDIDLKIADSILYNKVFLNDISYNQRGSALQKYLKDNNSGIPVLGGANVQREGITGIKGFISINLYNTEEKSTIKEESLLVQNIVSHVENPVSHVKIISCVPDSKGFAILDTINQITLTDNKYSAAFVSVLLNSRLLNWYVYRFIYGKAIRTMHFDNGVTARVPIPVLAQEQSNSFVNMNSEIESIIISTRQRTKQFSNYLSEIYLGSEGSNKVLQWHKLSLKQLINEMNKVRFKSGTDPLSSKDEYDITGVFTSAYSEVIDLFKERSDKQLILDLEICSIYGLSATETEFVLKNMP